MKYIRHNQYQILYLGLLFLCWWISVMNWGVTDALQLTSVVCTHTAAVPSVSPYRDHKLEAFTRFTFVFIIIVLLLCWKWSFTSASVLSNISDIGCILLLFNAEVHSINLISGPTCVGITHNNITHSAYHYQFCIVYHSTKEWGNFDTRICSNSNSFPQGGPGHLYLLKNKVATFAKVEKEDDMIQ